MSDNSLVCFKAISKFANELGELFSKKQRSLQLYCRLINKTTLAHEKPIQKHISAFKKFCVTNRQAITAQDHKEFVVNNISYSQRVFIDMKHIFKMADKNTQQIIWQHILCISAFVDPAGKAKTILLENLKNGKTGENESNFLTDVFSKIEETIDPSADPATTIASVMSSGIITDLIGGMQEGLSEGKLDIGQLLGSVQGLMGKLGGDVKDNPEAQNMMNMMNSMMSSMGKQQENGTAKQQIKPPPVSLELVDDGKDNPDSGTKLSTEQADKQATEQAGDNEYSDVDSD